MELPFHRPPHNDDSLLGPRDSSFYQHQIRFRPNVYNLEVLHRDLFVAPMAGHLFSFPDSTRKGTVADGPTVAKVFVGTVRPWESGKRPPFDYARESVSLRRSGYIDTIPCLEQVCRFDFLADLQLRPLVYAKFLQNLESTLPSLSHVALLRFVDSLILLTAEAHLDGIVSVCGTLFLLHHNAWTRLNNCDRNDISFRVVELRHANFFSDKARHKSFLRT